MKKVIAFLNRQRRWVLQGMTPHDIVHKGRQENIFTPKDRCAIMNDIVDIAASIYRIFTKTNRDSINKARRLAAEVWLKK